jgi:putative oxidoreductase
MTSAPPALAIPQLVAAGAAVLLLVGLWTPVAGVLIGVAELALAFLHPTDPWMFIHLGVLGAALAMLGPGGWSVDAHLFGRKHIQIPPR